MNFLDVVSKTVIPTKYKLTTKVFISFYKS
jgi:hypothetical protein